MAKKVSNKQKIMEERRKIYERMMNTSDPEVLEALAKAYGDNVKASTPESNGVEIAKIVAIAATGVLSAATTVYVAKLTLSYESEGKIFSKLYPYKGEVKTIKF